jgi:hypothetical protein
MLLRRPHTGNNYLKEPGVSPNAEANVGFWKTLNERHARSNRADLLPVD